MHALLKYHSLLWSGYWYKQNMWKWYLSCRPPETRSHIARLSKKALTLIKSALQYKIQIKSRQFCTLRSCTDKSYVIKCTSYGSWTWKNCTWIRICKICSELAHRWGDILVNFDPCINEIFPYYWSTIASIIFFFQNNSLHLLFVPERQPWEIKWPSIPNDLFICTF